MRDNVIKLKTVMLKLVPTEPASFTVALANCAFYEFWNAALFS
jgi:hypothetical protein